ncbi:DUF1264 domain-containing protein [Microbispora sp. ATCC PTA-5024]|uniref:DUF1264 domain-containing protein n=1 Tax=Microbispora sp. ATCC PTA-5024 TaxID=316330 RepID=UPI0018DBF346|nr:DUF1264 domain-containing protein [Microbispora sp. ATCC PTA-5024]
MSSQDIDEAMSPIGNHGLFFCGFHVAKRDTSFQVTTMHYCGMRGQGDYEMHQCLLYDSAGPAAKLLGVEYIVSDKLYRSLPHEEKKYWHPHTYEVLSGGLVAPGMDDQAELEFMRFLLTTWGKTWHTWPDPTTPIPLGEPLLMWALTRDDQADDVMVAERDKRFGVSTARDHPAGMTANQPGSTELGEHQSLQRSRSASPPGRSLTIMSRQWASVWRSPIASSGPGECRHG